MIFQFSLRLYERIFLRRFHRISSSSFSSFIYLSCEFHCCRMSCQWPRVKFVLFKTSSFLRSFLLSRRNCWMKAFRLQLWKKSWVSFNTHIMSTSPLIFFATSKRWPNACLSERKKLELSFPFSMPSEPTKFCEACIYFVPLLLITFRCLMLRWKRTMSIHVYYPIERLFIFRLTSNARHSIEVAIRLWVT